MSPYQPYIGCPRTDFLLLYFSSRGHPSHISHICDPKYAKVYYFRLMSIDKLSRKSYFIDPCFIKNCNFLFQKSSLNRA